MSKGPRYPRLGTFESNSNPRSGRRCKACGAERAGRVHIQVSWSRGDDVIVACCKRCYTTREAQELLVAGNVPADVDPSKAEASR